MAQKQYLSPEQDKAANPSENVWVQANAGTGKTSVLVQRLLRILFRADPGTGILCLTYTNAAAGEMRNRILAMLRKWVMVPDEELSERLYGVTLNTEPTQEDLNRARNIFFKYIDNPEMLKIKTIHGFCEEILHRFPIEAGLSPSWSLVSDANQKVLLQEAFENMIKTSGNNPVVSDAFAHIVCRVSEYDMPEILQDLTRQYKTFFEIENHDNYRQYFIDTIENFLNLKNTILSPENSAELLNIIKNAEYEQNTRKTPAKYLDKIINFTKQYVNKTIDFEEYKFAYLTQKLDRIKDVSQKDYLQAEQERVYARAQHETNRQIFQDTVAFFDLAAAFASSYISLKRTHNLLDFDDLILYTRRLFAKPDSMGWVLSQLDLSLNHILVDEAQDTGPQQWDILRMIAGDFFTDGDTAAAPHSLFVVGDSKQSIYGFQGADPYAFAASRHDIARQIENNMRTICEIPLAQSFRSTEPVLQTVDAFFENRQIIELTGFANTRHKCFRTGTPGLVEINPVCSKKENDTDVRKYITSVADKIESLISHKECRPADIMVLVQKRRPMAPMLVNELKRRHIEVAGSDRIVLPDFPAIRDLLNLTRFCLTTNDDYSLCCALKSPLFRLNEGDIFNLCSKRTNEIKKQAPTADANTVISVFDILESDRPEIHARLAKMVAWAQSYGPYTFFSNVLNSDNTREDMIAALGGQIIDPLEEFMTICLAYERTQPGTMRDFLKWFITGSSEIKRDMNESCGVRIVTVHGSKGLEAPVVFLIDTTKMPDSDRFINIPDKENTPGMPTPWIWTPRQTLSRQYQKAADAESRKKIAEYYRLLYVAMTRARDRLYIYGHTANKKPHENSWHARLWETFATPDATEPIRITNA